MANIAVKKDIVLEVSRRLDMPYEKVEYVYDFLFGRYLRKLTRKAGVSTIVLPHLGQLHMKYGYFRNYLKGKMKNFHKYSKGSKSQLLKIKEKIENMEEGFKENDSTCKAHMKNYKIRNKYFTLGKNFEELQKFQNEE